MPFHPQPLLDGRLQFKIVALPILLSSQPLPPAILDCFANQPTCRTVPHFSTVEYMATAETGPVSPPVFLFVVDTCMIEDEIGFLKSALAQAVELLPDQSLFGFITFGTYVQVHELGFGLLPKSYVFRGTKEVTKDQILEKMGFFAGKTKPTSGVIAGARDGLSAESIARFLLPASECEFMVNSVKNSPYLHKKT